ncbi:hypothetical protein HU200_030761 [Digitaria exilis]|uniref:RING-type domain-containing protein n=1 Tax=Digitaria exilis TaxID=1010633 RepID=A0A835BS84_9POAL|nr:hypothetical protein HU200_030761 [Digitaria exilis]CAB3459300.1 unnamed protein product [Digitaria exilis]
MRVYLRATAIAAAPPALAPAAGSISAAAGGGVGLGYGIAIAVGILVLISTVMLASYLCVLTKAGAAHLAAADAPVGPPTSPSSVVPGLDDAAIDALCPKYPHAGSGDEGPCAICLGELALRRGSPGCVHRFHASCAELWLRVSATCPVCRDSPVPSPAATPLAEDVVPLAAHAHVRFLPTIPSFPFLAVVVSCRHGVYAGEPGELARLFRPLPKTEQRFFFTSRKLQPQRAGKAIKATRAAGAGSWQSQGSKDVLNKDKEKVGEVTKLRYKKGGKYTDWLMDEYSCGLQDAIVGGDRQLVFCNIYVSPRAHQDSVAYKESAAFFAPPPPSAPVVVMAQAAAPHKRQVPEIASPPCPKRMRIAAVAPSHPVAQPPRPCVLQYGVAPPSSTPSVSVTRPSPASVAQPPAPAPTRLTTQAPAPPRPLGQPKQQQQMPPATPPVARASPHMPVQAPACHCRPQASVQDT